MFVYLPLRYLIVIYRFLSLFMFTQINKLIAEDSYCSYILFIFCMIACVTVPGVQKVGISGPWGWVLWKTTITPQACPFLFNFAEKFTIHLLYHIANFDGGTQCVIWGVICIFMKSTSHSPWNLHLRYRLPIAQSWRRLTESVKLCVWQGRTDDYSSWLFGQCWIQYHCQELMYIINQAKTPLQLDITAAMLSLTLYRIILPHLCF